MQINPKLSKAITEALIIILRNPPRIWGFIEDAAPVEINGRSGFLVWDYIAWNQLTFASEDKEVTQPMFKSKSDEETRRKFDELVAKYGQKH